MVNEIRQWIEIDSLDTLFFRGSEPMVAGESHEVRSIFPPMPTTIIGALRTAILVQRRVDLDAFLRREGDEPAIAHLPFLGNVEKPGFAIAGPLIKAAIADGISKTFLPAPANWLSEKNKNGNEIYVSTAKSGAGEIETLGLTGGARCPLLVETPQSTSMKSLHGYWTNAEAFSEVAKGNCWLPVLDAAERMRDGKPALFTPDAFFCREQRTGIALDITPRRPRKGHLYTSTHVRLIQGVRLLVGLSEKLVDSHLDTEGLIQLGGEQRLVRYRLCNNKVAMPTSISGWALALTPIVFESLSQFGLKDKPRASGALLRMAGWDMKNSFHKPSVAYLPMGSVIQIGDSSVSIPFGFIRI